MKSTHLASVLTILLLGACAKTPGSDAQNRADKAMPMSAAEHTQMTEQPKSASGDAAQPAKTASATGTVESVDAATGRITLAHGPVDALGWPAMTMGFNATPEQIASVQPGQSVRFEFTAQGTSATITRIDSAR